MREPSRKRSPTTSERVGDVRETRDSRCGHPCETARLALRHRVTVFTDCATRGWNGGFPERARESSPLSRARLRLVRRRERRAGFRERASRGRPEESVSEADALPERTRGRARGVRGVGDERADECRSAGASASARARCPPARVPNTRARGRRGRRPRADGGVRQIASRGAFGRAPRARRRAPLRRSRSDDGGVHNEGAPRARPAPTPPRTPAGRECGRRMDNHSEEKAEESKNDECCF